MDNEELEGMRIARLRRPGNRVGYWLQRVVERRGFDDLSFAFQFLVHLLSELGFLIGDGLGNRRLSAAEEGDRQRDRQEPEVGLRGLQHRMPRPLLFWYWQEGTSAY